jgi:nitrous oxidase accessory protein NosD
MKYHIFLAATMAAGLASVSSATVINVSAGGNVQTAINSAAATGDEVVLAAGNYTGSIDISGKSLVLRGASAATRPVFSFTATLAYGTAFTGMAVRGDGTSVTVQNIIFLPGTTGFTGTPKGLACSA